MDIKDSVNFRKKTFMICQQLVNISAILPVSVVPTNDYSNVSHYLTGENFSELMQIMLSIRKF